MNPEKSIRFVVDDEDKFLLASIAKLDGRTSMSATIRRLIRKEAQQRGIEVKLEARELQPA